MKTLDGMKKVALRRKLLDYFFFIALSLFHFLFLFSLYCFLVIFFIVLIVSLKISVFKPNFMKSFRVLCSNMLIYLIELHAETKSCSHCSIKNRKRDQVNLLVCRPNRSYFKLKQKNNITKFWPNGFFLI